MARPPVIHQIWVGGPRPKRFVDWAETWRRQNPGWDYRLWTDDDLGWLKNRDLYDRAAELTPERYVPRFRSNLARYEIIARHGGIYVDCDTEAVGPIPDDLPVGAWAVEERPGVVANTYIGGVPDDPFWTKVVDEAPQSIARYRGKRSPLSCGPLHVTRVAKRHGGLTVLPTDRWLPYHWTELADANVPDGAVAHHAWTACSAAVSVIVPWTAGCRHREAAWRWLRDRLEREHPDWQIVEAKDPGDPDRPGYSRAAAIVDAIPDTYGDVIVVSDADVWSDGLDDAVAAVRDGARWAIPHATVHRLDPDATTAVLAGGPPGGTTHETPYVGTPTGGLVVLPRETLIAHPPDVTFRGWGGEDEAWGRHLSTLVGPAWRGDGPLWHLWHPPQSRRSRQVGNRENWSLLSAYRRATGNVDAMRALARQKEDDGMGIYFRDLRRNKTVGPFDPDVNAASIARFDRLVRFGRYARIDDGQTGTDGEDGGGGELTVDELKKALKAAGLPVSGNKAELVARLNEADGPGDADDEDANADGQDG